MQWVVARPPAPRCASAEGAAQAREEIRKAWEKEYRDCLDGVGRLMAKLAPEPTIADLRADATGAATPGY
jgi:hypothetical protein